MEVVLDPTFDFSIFSNYVSIIYHLSSDFDPVTTASERTRLGFMPGNTPTPEIYKSKFQDEDIVYALGDKRYRDERTGLRMSLVFRLWRQLHRRVAIHPRDNR